MVRRVKRSSMRRRRSMRGGWQKLSPASMDDSSMIGPTQMSNAQGQEYQALHKGQHGGAQLVDPAGVSSGDQGLLPADLRAVARVTPQDEAIAGIQGMKDQGGGGRRRRSRRRRSSRKKHGGSRRKHGGSRKKHGGSRKNGMYGGAVLSPASADAPGLILSEKVTESGMNPEWKLAHDPTSFVPDAVKATTKAM